jgi:hypothetical protein
MKPEPTIAELADIGAEASQHWNRRIREAFAKAVRDAVLDHIAESGKMVAPDPYAELKAAHAAGKVIQMIYRGAKVLGKEYSPDGWKDIHFPVFDAPPEDYRIKPEPVIVPLDYDDIRATDEFKSKGGGSICTLLSWDATTVRTSMYTLNYDRLASICLRRQHGSNEWKPCTKEITK